MQNQQELSFVTLLIMISFAAVNAVLIAPALPAIATYFDVSANLTQQLVTWYLIGYAFGQLLYGPLANRYGRKPALYMGTGLQIVSSLVCVLAGIVHVFPLLMLGRFTLALGAGVGLKMSFTLLNECYEPKVVSQKVSYLLLAFATTPGIAMAVGGYLNQQYGWMSCLYAGAMYGLLLLPLLTRLPETKKILDLQALKISHLLREYLNQFKNLKLVAGGILMGLATTAFYVFAAIAPFVAINMLGMTSKAYGLANLFPSITYGIGAIISARLTEKMPLYKIMRLGVIIIAIAVSAMLLATLLHASPLFSLFLPISTVYFGEAFIYPNASAIAMSKVSDTAHASAVMNFLTILLPTVMVLSLGIFTIHLFLLPTILIVLAMIIIVVYQWLKRIA